MELGVTAGAQVLAFLGLGTGEVILVLLLILVLFGADRVPDLARALGRAQARFNAAKSEVVETLEIERAGMTREQLAFERAREQQVRAAHAASGAEDAPGRAESTDDARAKPPDEEAGNR